MRGPAIILACALSLVASESPAQDPKKDPKERKDPWEETRTILPLSPKRFPALIEEGYEIKTSLLDMVVLQRPGKPLPVYFCRVEPYVERAGIAERKPPTWSQPPRLSVKGCFEQAAGGG